MRAVTPDAQPHAPAPSPDRNPGAIDPAAKPAVSCRWLWRGDRPLPIVNAMPVSSLQVGQGLPGENLPTMSRNLLRPVFFLVLLGLVLYVAFGGGL